MSLSDGLLKLRWNNHEATFCHILHRLRSKPRYADATLACEGRLFMVHRLVLATCSDFFDEIFQQTPSDSARAVIVLNEARAQDVECLLDYMYCGQVNVRQANLGSLLRTAESLKIKGLAASETTVASTNTRRNQDLPSPPDSPPPKKKRKKKDKGGMLSTSPSRDQLPASSTPLSSSWNPSNESQKLSSLLSSTAPSSLQPPISSPSPTVPLYTSAPSSQQPPHLPLTAPIKAGSLSVEGGKGKPGWLQIVSSMRQGSAASESVGALNQQQQQQQLVKQTLMQVVKNKASLKSLDLDSHPSQFLQTEIKEEVKDEPIGTDDVTCGDEENTGGWGESDPPTQEPCQMPGYRKVPSLYATSSHPPPPPGLHPVVSGSSSSLTPHTTSGPPHVLPLGLFRVGSYAVQSGGQAWEASTQRRQSPEPSTQDTQPSASQQAMDLGMNHLMGLNKKGSSPSHSTMSPKLMPYATCSNCYTNNTKLWRRNEKGEIVCNACGLYFKLHGVNRPSHLFRLAPMTRRRNPKKKKDGSAPINVTTSTTSLPTDTVDTTVSDSSQDKEGMGCEGDPGEGLAVLNAALTLNFLANAKAHQSEALAAQRTAAAAAVTKTPGDTVETRPPPPPLLKIPMQEDEVPATTPAEPPGQQHPGEHMSPHHPSPHQPSPHPSPPPHLSPTHQDSEGRKFIAQLLDK